VRDVQTIQKFKIIHVFGSSYCWLYLNFVRVGKLCESVCIIAVKKKSNFSFITTNEDTVKMRLCI
jgi:hypothetical protein